MHLGAKRTRTGSISPTAKTKTLLLFLAICIAVGAAQMPAQGIDVLHQLGLGGKDIQHPSTVSTMPLSSVPLPQGVHLTASGVVLTRDAHIESPITQVIPSSLGNQFTLLIGLHSYRVNNAFLFSIRNKNRLLFGVQLLPRKVVVYIGGKQSVYFDYSIHDEQWHSFAIDIRDKTVSMFAECGKKYYSRETLSKVQIFDLDGLFTLGRMNSQSVSFEGVICQLDIIPSAQASANYCKYVKQQCRQAETYRSLPAPPDTSAGVSVNFPSKQFGDNTQSEHKSFYTQKEALNLPINNTAPVHSLPESLALRTVTPSELAKSEPQSTTIRPEASVQENFSLSIHQQGLIKKRNGTKKTLGSPQNSSDNATEDAGGKSELPLISPVKQSKIKDAKTQVKAKQHSDEPLEMQQILNTTLYRATVDLSLDNQLNPWEEGAFDADETYDAENGYEFDVESYSYDYEDLNKMFEMENTRGPKGETGPQ
uniref:Thrombospondin-like N-terminal domain-containing protein n=1 Tax=Chrysemys picta bellii TaxID=8478 RepID=A0A8C3ITM3_CHRPI